MKRYKCGETEESVKKWSSKEVVDFAPEGVYSNGNHRIVVFEKCSERAVLFVSEVLIEACVISSGTPQYTLTNEKVCIDFV